ncbi:MAG: hypothetical protein AB7P35_17770 [Hyphomonadaceae bacterium]
MIAGIGHNGGPALDEDLPPKELRVIDRAIAEKVEIAATMAAKRCAIAKKAIQHKRQGGEEGRFLRGFCIYYTRSIGAPAWMTALIWDLNRKQIGEEEARFLAMLARNETLEQEVQTLSDMCDAAIRFQPKVFIREGLAERMADAAAKKAIKAAKEAADLLEQSAPPKPKRIKPKTFSPEVEEIAAGLAAARRAKERETATKILNAIIARGEAAKATKDEQKEAARARKALAELAASNPAPPSRKP